MGNFLHKEKTKTSQIQTQAPVEVQREAVAEQRHEEQAEQVQRNVQILREEDFEVLDEDIIGAAQIFTNQEANLLRQRDPRKMRESERKSARKQAAEEQAQRDRARKRELTQWVHIHPTDDGDLIQEKSIVSLDMGTYDRLLKQGPREDVTGFVRRTNERKFRNGGGSRMEAAVRQDMANLVKNISLDLILEGDGTTPENLHKYRDAFYFTNLYGERMIREKSMELSAMREAGAGDAEIRAAKTKLAKLEKMVLWQKSNGSQFVASMMLTKKEIRARELAIRQVTEETTADSLYARTMVQLLQAEMEDLQRTYEASERSLRTVSGKLDTAQGTAQSQTQDRLAELRRELKAEGTTDARKEEIHAEARAIFNEYDFEGNVFG